MHNKNRNTHGFTLIELLVVITIVIILAGVTLGALSQAREYAREYRTKSTISKLDRVIREMYASYRSRRVPINIPTSASRADAARLRLEGLRRTMLMEMPERYGDVPNSAPSTTTISAGSASAPMAVPALAHAYAAMLSSHRSGPADNSHGECLYMIVAVGNPQRLEDFQASEIGDTDGDGLPEFVDGWGRPIYFLRWAPGFDQSDIQPPPAAMGNQNSPQFRHDPFDVHNVEPAATLLLPLIYSAGPDGEYGIDARDDHNYTGQPWATSVGAPDPTQASARFDNIHNHRIEQR